jgi:hypothetical protein
MKADALREKLSAWAECLSTVPTQQSVSDNPRLQWPKRNSLWLLATCLASVLWLAHFTTLGPKLLADDYPKSLDEVLAHVEKLERPTELETKVYDCQDKVESYGRRAINGELKLVVLEYTEDDGRHICEAFVLSRNYFFTASRNGPDKPWLLTQFISPIVDEAQKTMENEWKSQSRWLNFREAVGDNRLRALLSQPDIVEVNLDPPDSHGLVKLTMNIANPDTKLPDESPSKFPLWIKKAKVSLDPNQQYCVADQYREHSRFDSSGTVRVLEWGEKDGHKYPLKSIESHSKLGDIFIREVTSIRFDEVPESEFTLEAFGIPNPYDSVPTDTLWSPTLIMAIAGVVFLAVGFAFRFAQKRRVA